MPQIGMTLRQKARYQRRSRFAAEHHDPLSPRVLSRACIAGNAGRDFPYDSLVATGVVDRSAWAEVVRELLPITKGKKATLARLLGVDPKTIDLWLDCKVSVSEASVRQVADKTERNAMELLIRVGYYSLREMPFQPVPDEILDEEIAVVLESNLDDQTKAEIIRELERWRAEDRDIQERLAQRDKERRIEQLRQRIDQARRAG